MDNILILNRQGTNLKSFIKFWAKLYDYDNNTYKEYIHKKINSENLNRLFQWKNGKDGKFSDSQIIFLKKIRIGELNKLRNNSFENIEKKLEYITTGIIWKIFLMHILNPNEIPIFDRHVYRAYSFIKFGKITELPTYNKTKYKEFKEGYRKFFTELKQETNLHHKTIDDALWAYGKFLKSYSVLLDIK